MTSIISKICRRFLPVLLLVTITLGARAQTRLSLSLKDVTLEVALDAIERSSPYLVTVASEEVNLNSIVSIETENAGITETLDSLLAGLPVQYRITGRNIMLSASKAKATPLTIGGKLVDALGQPVIGAGISVKGTALGTISDLDGEFSLEIPDASDEMVLEFSALGYTPITMALGTRTLFNLTMEEETISLEGTVVTALGIRRAQKALSYNVQEVKSDALTAVKDANFVNSLSGKVAGLVINSSSSGVGGASKVVMRGMKSITQSSNALYVIDGVPMYTRARDASTEFGSQGSTDPIADINPEDIESISVLSGAAAAALYGSDAANGAIVVTTRKGQEGSARVNFTSSVELMSPLVLPRFQNRYGTGDLNSSVGSDVKSWGTALNEANNPNYDPAKDYFCTGLNHSESISLSTGTHKNQTYLSLSSLDSKGIVPNNAYRRYNLSFRNSTSFLGDSMHLDTGVSYVHQYDRNMINQGTYNNPLVGAWLFPRGNDWEAVRMYERYDVSRRLYTQYWPIGDAGMTMQNPYWINYRNVRENSKDRFMLNASLSWKVFAWLNLSARANMDRSMTDYSEKFYASTFTQLTELSSNGLYGITRYNDVQHYVDAMANIDKRFGEHWSLTANLGASLLDMSHDDILNRGPIADGQITDEKPGLANVFNIQNLSNSAKTTRLQEGWREQTQSVFASTELGYKGAYYLTLTARNDWPSQLAGPHSHRSSFFYPSAGLSVLLSEIISMPSWIEYLKIRGSYASVGTAFERYIANPMYSWNSSTLSWNTKTQYPVYDLKPELTNSYEAGLTIRAFRMFSFDLAYYHTNTLNQTFNPQISTGSGSSDIYIQSGNVLNQGVELSLGFSHEMGKAALSSDFTFSANRNRIVSLADNVLNAATGEYFSVDMLDMKGLGLAHFILKEGGTLGDLYSLADYSYDSEDMIVINEDGTLTTRTITDPSEYVFLGSVLPSANLSWRGGIRYGQLSLSALVTARLGGIVYSSTQAVLDYYGVSEASAQARDNGGITVNGTDLVDANKWYSSVGGTRPLPQEYTYSATNLRLQEVSLAYTIPRDKLWNLCDMTLSLSGKNLLMIFNKAPFDPESVATTGNYYQGIDHFMMPSLRSASLNLRLVF